jgi:hypothetical protein
VLHVYYLGLRASLVLVMVVMVRAGHKSEVNVVRFSIFDGKIPVVWNRQVGL